VGLKPNLEKVRAVVKKQHPEGHSDILWLNGVVNNLQLSSCFLPNLFDVMKPLQDLTHKEAVWCWDELQEKLGRRESCCVCTHFGNYKSTEVLKHRHAKRARVMFCDRSIRRTVHSNDLVKCIARKELGSYDVHIHNVASVMVR